MVAVAHVSAAADVVDVAEDAAVAAVALVDVADAADDAVVAADVVEADNLIAIHEISNFY